MRIIFIGKGGSGKSTLSSLFSLYAANSRNVLLVDTDVNSHTSDLLGIDVPETKKLNYQNNPREVRNYLRGNNVRVQLDEFIKTTPPGAGSHLVTLQPDDPLLRRFATTFASRGYYLAAGSYQLENIGTSCHHGAQAVAENIMSHTVLKKDEVLVADASAGADCFGNTLFAQDMIVFVLKPERESLSVYRQCAELAEAAGVVDRLYVVANNVATKPQQQFIAAHAPQANFIGTFSYSETIESNRLEGRPLSAALLSSEQQALFDRILNLAAKQEVPSETRYRFQAALHHQLATKPSWEKTYRKGLSDQIDPNFTYPAL